MGVIYKLKEDVISFVVDQKKNNPSIGVRTLAALTSEKFQVKVSKSSVNTILKNASLSSSVGRRAGEHVRTEKFHIPPTKKKEISSNMQKLGFIKKESVKAKPIVKEPKEQKPKKDKPKEVREETPSVTPKRRKEDLEAAKDTTLPLMPDPLADREPAPSDKEPEEETVVAKISREQEFADRVKQLQARKQNKKIAVPKGMGFVFLQSAQWEVASHSMVGELFKNYVPGPLSEGLDAAADMFMFLKFLGVESFEKVSGFQEHGLWRLNNIQNASPDKEDVFSKIKELFQWHQNISESTASRILMQYNLEKNHLFSSANGFQLSLEDGSQLMMDASLSSFQSAKVLPVSICDRCAFNKAMAWLSMYVISNIQSPVFHRVPGELEFDPILYDMIAVFENMPGKTICKAAVLNEHNEAMATFATIPTQKRSFLIGVDPKQKEFSQLTKSVKWAGKKPFYHEGTARMIHYAQIKTDFMASHLEGNTKDFRVITLWQNQEKNPSWAILTNDLTTNSENIVGAYLSRWPRFRDHQQKLPETSALLGEGGEPQNSPKENNDIEFSGIFADLVSLLNTYCQTHFFPKTISKIGITQMLQDIYAIPGHYYGTKDSLIVTLDRASSTQYAKDLEHAIHCINQRNIVDRIGRRLWIEM